MKNPIIVFLCVILISVGCNTPKSDEEQVQECFSNYKTALQDQNGKSALDYVDKSTINYYEEMLQYAIEADSLDINKMSLMDKITILSIRHKISPQEIMRMDGKALFIYAINNGMIGSNSIDKITLSTIKIKESTADGYLMANGQELPMAFEFKKEDTEWKINLTSIFDISETGLKQAAYIRNLKENEFIVTTISEINKKKVSDNIWHPIQ